MAIHHKLLLLVCFLLHLSLAFSTVYPVDDNTWESVVMQSRTPVQLVFFRTAGCGTCNIIMAPIVERISNEYPADGAGYFVMDMEKSPIIAKRYGVVSAPTYLFFKSTQKRAEMRGLFTGWSLQVQIKKLILDKYEPLP